MIHGLRSTEDAVISDHAAFDSPTCLQLYDRGKDTRMREIYFVNVLSAIREDATMLQLNEPKMRFQVFEIYSANFCENTIL
jgi:hypothetical protein